MPPRTATVARGRASCGSCIAGRILGPAESSAVPGGPATRAERPSPIPPTREAECSDPSSSKPDFVAQEHEILRRCGASAGPSRGCAPRTPADPTWSFLDGPITANNPMGVHHAWGRAYKDLYQRFHAMLGEDQRYQNGFDCQGLWVEVNVERDLGFTTQARHRGVRHRRVRDACASSAS